VPFVIPFIPTQQKNRKANGINEGSALPLFLREGRWSGAQVMGLNTITH
jgi:hypothetical protein